MKCNNLQKSVSKFYPNFFNRIDSRWVLSYKTFPLRKLRKCWRKLGQNLKDLRVDYAKKFYTTSPWLGQERAYGADIKSV